MQQGKRTVIEFHHDAFKRVHRGWNLKKLQDDRLFRAEHRARRYPKNQRVTDLASSPGYRDAYWIRHGSFNPSIRAPQKAADSNLVRMPMRTIP